jgi:polar amino acid transport system permease protein/cystine transport system permease protein
VFGRVWGATSTIAFWTTMADVLPHFLPVLLAGLVVAVKVALGAFALALTAGLILALLTRSPVRALRAPAWGYIELVRGTPALTQLFILYFGLSEIGLSLSPMTAAITGLGANGAAYLANIYRAGIDAVDRGQREAALSLGLTPTAVLVDVVLPQAVRIMIPPFCNHAIQLLKDTSLVSAVAAPEIMFRARGLVMETYLSMHVYLLVAVIYLACTIPMAHLAARIERRLGRGR